MQVGENEKEEDVHRKLDLDLDVASWRAPGGVDPARIPQRVTEDGLKVPSWWTDDEEASQSFLLSQGAVL